MKRVTKMKSPIGMIFSQYGWVLWRDWCKLEVERINKNYPGDAYLTRKPGSVGVARRSLVTNKEGE